MKKKPNILHIANDEKFVSAAKILFEKAFPGSNYFYIVKPPADPPLKYVSRGSCIETVVLGKGAIDILNEKSLKADAVVLHGIDKVKGTILDQAVDKGKFAGIIFGAELYNKSVAGDDYLGDLTRSEKERLDRLNPIDIIKSLYRFLAYRNSKKKVNNLSLQDFTRQLTFIGTHYPESLIKWKEKGVISDKVDTFHFSYYPMEHIVADEKLRASGSSILLGNSASFTNNHLEIMHFLKNIGVEKKRILAPLSYGNSRYAKRIEKKGRSLFGEHFTAVKEYLSLDEYNKLIAECEIVVMNHMRSQGLGSTLAAIYMGARVFLNETEIYRYFSSIGCKVFKIQDELKDQLKHGTPLKPDIINRNRELIRAHFSEEQLVSSIRSSFSLRYNFSVNEPQNPPPRI